MQQQRLYDLIMWGIFQSLSYSKTNTPIMHRIERYQMLFEICVLVMYL